MDSLRLITDAFGDDHSPQEAFRHVNRLSSPVLRTLRALQSLVSRAAGSGSDAPVQTSRMMLHPASLHLLFPTLSGVLSLHGVLPGSEATLFMLNR